MFQKVSLKGVQSYLLSLGGPGCPGEIAHKKIKLIIIVAICWWYFIPYIKSEYLWVNWSLLHLRFGLLVKNFLAQVLHGDGLSIYQHQVV